MPCCWTWWIRAHEFVPQSAVLIGGLSVIGWLVAMRTKDSRLIEACAAYFY